MRFTTNLNLIDKRQYTRLIALILLIEGLSMIPPLSVALFTGEQRCAIGLFVILAISVSLGFIIRRIVPSSPGSMRSRDGYFFIMSSMMLAIFTGALPFFFAGEGYSLIDSIFESTAGWTTTGAFVIPKDKLILPLILWKSELNFMGGFVMIFLTVSIFQKLGIGGQKSVAHDIPGANFEKLTAKMGDTARILVRIYILLTISEIVLLTVLGMDPFYAVCNSLSTMSTSGLVVSTGEIPGFVLTPAVKFVITVYTVLASLNFVFYFLLYTKNYKLAFRNYEIKLYFIIIAITSAVSAVALAVAGRYGTPLESVYNSVIQMVSYASTSGFTFSDISTWPTVSKILLIILSLTGGCGFSTSSGLKVHRVVILWKIVTRGIYKRIHPRSLKPVMVGGKAIPADRAASITVLGLLYFAVLVIAAIIFSLDDLGMETSISAALATLTNTGTSFGLLTDGFFGVFTEPARLFASVVMITGRLELFAIFVMFSPAFWDTNRVTN